MSKLLMLFMFFLAGTFVSDACAQTPPPSPPPPHNRTVVLTGFGSDPLSGLSAISLAQDDLFIKETDLQTQLAQSGESIVGEQVILYTCDWNGTEWLCILKVKYFIR
jgi:FlaG/FlaF family flagellin (archaellin)